MNEKVVDNISVAAINIDSIDVSLNPRKITKADIKELTASIKRNGIMVPIAVRMSEDGTTYELCAGGRRVAAAKAAGLNLIPALVYSSDTTGEQVSKITHLENQFRKKLTPMEEALSTKKIYDACGQSYKDTAIILGINERAVACRVNVVGKISKSWIKEFADKDSEYNPMLVHLQLLAQFDKEVQERLYETIDDDDFNNIPWFKNKIEREQREVKTAIFGIADCEKCQKRTCARPDLFGEITKKSVELCLDAACWNEKTHAFVLCAYEAAKEKYDNLKFGFCEYVGYNQRQEAIKIYGPCIELQDVEACKKNVKGAFPMFIAAGKNVGKVLWRKLKKTASKTASNNAEKATGPKSLKERRSLLDKKRWTFVNHAVVELLKKDWDVTQLKYENKAYAVMYLVTCFGIKTWTNNKFNDIHKFLDKKDVGETVSKLFEMMLDPFIQDVKWNGPITQMPTEYVTATEIIADIFVIDLKPIHESARVEYPEPKAWANLKADGTPKVKK